MRARTQMRIIAGALKGRRLAAPTWEGLRPTSDKLRETLFNMLARASRARACSTVCGHRRGRARGAEPRRGARRRSSSPTARAAALIARNLAACGVDGGLYYSRRATCWRRWRSSRPAPRVRHRSCSIRRMPSRRTRDVLGGRGGIPESRGRAGAGTGDAARAGRARRARAGARRPFGRQYADVCWSRRRRSPLTTPTSIPSRPTDAWRSFPDRSTR